MHKEEFAMKFAEWLQENRWYTYDPEERKWHYTFEHGTAMPQKTYDKNYKKGSYQLLLNFMTELGIEPCKTPIELIAPYGMNDEDFALVLLLARECMDAREQGRLLPEGVKPADLNSLFSKKNVLNFLEYKRKIGYYKENGNAISNEEIFDMYVKELEDGK